MKRLLISGCIGFGLLMAPSIVLAQDAAMRQAIQWEHYKDAAAARQAALEKQHPSVKDTGAASADRSSADREDVSGFSAGSSFRTEPTAAELAQAVAWEHHKDAAAARQASVERK